MKARKRVISTHSSPKTQIPQYQQIDRKKGKGKIFNRQKRERAAKANKNARALLLKPAKSNTIEDRVSKIVGQRYGEVNKRPVVV